ncbi:lipoprotein [Streptomyces sp. NPDC055078]
MRGVGAGLVPAALLAGVLTGCSALTTEATRDSSAKNPSGGESARSDKPGNGENVAAKGGTIGAQGSPCSLPVTFDLAEDWTAQAVTEDTEFGLTENGPVTLVCEIDAKPAGNIGFLRVWVGGRAGDDARAALDGFLAENAKNKTDVVYAKGKAGPFEAIEVSYLNTSEILDAPKKERSIAFSTAKGVVVLDLGGLDSEEHEQMLPAYELAKRSVAAV